jgi:GNAT superfamily N-acetyltransferase
MITALGPGHDRAGFRSGVLAFDRYLKAQAGRDSARRLAAVFVLLLPGDMVGGYYTLAPATLFLPDIVSGAVPKISRYPAMPAAKLSRLAVDRRHRGRGYGRRLLADAILRVHRSEFDPVAVIAEPQDETGRGFLTREGFLPLPESPRLFRPMVDFEAVLPA